MKKLLGLLLLVTFWLGGCATVGIEKVRGLPSQTKVATLSLLGDKLAIRHVGTVVFQNEKTDLPVPTWQVDRLAESFAARHLRAGAKFIPVDAQTDAARAAAGTMGTDFWTSGAAIKGGPAAITGLAAQAGADYVLVLGPSSIGDPFMGTNQSFSGYGIYQRSVFGRKTALNFLTLRVALFDGKSGAEVARTQGYMSSPRADTLWMDSSALVLDDVNTVVTKIGIEQLIDKLLNQCMHELALR